MRIKTSLLLLFCLTLTLQHHACAAEDTETIKIGAIFSLTGKAKDSNKPAVLGTHLAHKLLQEKGAILGRKIEIHFYDNKSTPIGSHLAAKKAVDDGVIAIIGASWSSHSIAIARVAQANHIPMISPISTTPSLTLIGDYIFRVCYTDTFQGKALAQFSYNDLEAKSAIIFRDFASDFSLNLSEIFASAFTSLGGKIVKIIDYRKGQPNYRAETAQTISHDVDIIFLSGHDESGVLAKDLIEIGQKATFIGSDGWAAKSFFTSGGNRIGKGYFINHWSSFQQDENSLNFKQKYRHLMPLMAPTPLAFDAVLLLVDAIENAGTTDGTAIKNVLKKQQHFNGVTGKIVFNNQGDASKKGWVIQIENGSSSLYKSIEHIH